MRLSYETVDPFILKGNILFKERDLPVPNLRKLPIRAKVEDSITTLIQKISFLPGETFILTGSFKQNPQLRFPRPLEFKLESCLNQTGFPHPTQVLGLPLCNSLVPIFCGNPQKTTQFSLMIQKKETYARLLLPQRKLNRLAKEQYATRQRVFLENKEGILECHKNLMSRFVEKTVLKNFYEELLKVQDPYQMLGKALKLYTDLFFKKIRETDDPKRLQSEGRKTLEKKLETGQAPFKKALFEFVLSLDKKLTPDLTAVALSKKLTENEKRLQIVVLKQLSSFLNELETNRPITVETFLKEIEEERSILETGIPEKWIVLSQELNHS